MTQLTLDFELEKRQIILSLQPGPFADILSGKKKHEYRRKFPNEPVNAFIYVSSPIKQIKAYIEFGQPIFDYPEKIGLIAEEEGTSTASGIHNYMAGLEKGFAIPILSIREISPISFAKLKDSYNFTAPQSYLNLGTNPALQKELLTRLK